MFDTAPGWQSRMSASDRSWMDKNSEAERLRDIVRANKGDRYASISAKENLKNFLDANPSFRRDGDPK